ncbi:MAG: DUF2017 family protein, partial [Actinomycetota bacterium]
MADIRRKKGRVTIHLEPEESQVIRHLADEHRRTLTAGGDERVTKRLFPAAYEDATDEAAYRDLIGDSLRNEKIEALERMVSSLDDRKIELDDDDLVAWLATIADIRVAVGTHIDVDEDKMSAPLDVADPDASEIALIH